MATELFLLLAGLPSFVAVSAILSAIGGMYEDNLYLSTLYEYLKTPLFCWLGG